MKQEDKEFYKKQILQINYFLIAIFIVYALTLLPLLFLDIKPEIGLNIFTFHIIVLIIFFLGLISILAYLIYCITESYSKEKMEKSINNQERIINLLREMNTSFNSFNENINKFESDQIENKNDYHYKINYAIKSVYEILEKYESKVKITE